MSEETEVAERNWGGCKKELLFFDGHGKKKSQLTTSASKLRSCKVD